MNVYIYIHIHHKRGEPFGWTLKHDTRNTFVTRSSTSPWNAALRSDPSASKDSGRGQIMGLKWRKGVDSSTQLKLHHDLNRYHQIHFNLSLPGVNSRFNPFCCWMILGGFKMESTIYQLVPSGNLLHSYWKWPLIVDFPIKNGDFP